MLDDGKEQPGDLDRQSDGFCAIMHNGMGSELMCGEDRIHVAGAGVH
jgi:hypothetical protein